LVLFGLACPGKKIIQRVPGLLRQAGVELYMLFGPSVKPVKNVPGGGELPVVNRQAEQGAD
jgi:hypothetical protein